MRPGREIDARIAKEVFGYKVWAQNKELFENAPKGDRPLRRYSKEIEWATEIVEFMKITLLPIQGGDWFAFIGPAVKQGWESPQALLEFLASGKFNECGAAVGTDLPAIICEAALKAVEKRRTLAAETQHQTPNLEVVSSATPAEATPEFPEMH